MNKLQVCMTVIITFIAVHVANVELLAQDQQNQLLVNHNSTGNILQWDTDRVLLADLLSRLEEKFSVTFLYDHQTVTNKYVSRSKAGLSKNPGPDLSRILQELGLAYDEIHEGIFLLMPGQVPLDKASLMQTVSGTVIDAQSGETLPGVNVIVKGTTTGTSTDSDGAFELTVESLQDTLIFSFVGYQTQEVPISGRTEIEVALQSQAIAGEELVVVGYGTQQRRDLTGSISEVESESITDVPVPSVDEALRGKVAGARVTQNSGAPGSRIQVRIRGNNSVLASNSPLYVVDGVPINGGIDYLNPSDIESINILKDASATAIYGSRGANGVVLVSTRGGTEGSQSIEISSYYGIQTPIKKYDLMNAQQFAEIANRFGQNQLGEPYFDDLSQVQNVTDWQEEVLRNAPMQNHSLSFNGGDESTQYYLSGTFFGQEGILINSGTQKGSLNLNVNQEIKEWIDIAANFSITKSELKNVSADNVTRGAGVLSGAWASPPFVPTRNDDGEFYNVAQFGFSPNVLQNPLATATIFNQNVGTDLLSSITTNIRILEDLEFKILGSTQQNSTEGNYYSPTTVPGSSGSASTSLWRNQSYLLEGTLTYDRELRGGADGLTFTGGFTWEEFTSKYNGASGSGFATDVLLNNNLGAAENPSPPSSSVTSWTLLSGLGRVHYSLDDKYLFTGTMRADGSSRFGANHKWGFFPSGAFAWRLSNEPFVEEMGLFSELKLRVSYGESGNTAISPYQSLNRLATRRVTFGNSDVIGYSAVDIANPDLKWETTKQFNAGLDISFINNNLRFTLEYYRKSTTDLLANIPLPSSSGFQSVSTNLGEVQNKGFEFSLGTDFYKNEFSGSIDAQFSINRNEVIDIGGSDVFGPGISQPFSNSLNLVREGEPIGVFYGFLEDGLDENGFIKFQDLNNDGEITNSDRTILGNPHPDFIYGLNTSFFYNNFRLNAFVEGVYGNDLFFATAGHHANSFNRGENQFVDVYHNHWREEAPDPNAKYPRIDPATRFRTSDRFVKDGSYLRLKNIKLSYEIMGILPSIKTLELYVSGQNMITLTDYPGIEPEVNTTGGEGDLRMGVDQMAYPTAKIYTMGINIRL